jgi:hypothetical protein
MQRVVGVPKNKNFLGVRGRSLQIVHNGLIEGQTADMDEAGWNAMPSGARLDASGTLHHVMVRGIERN